jgi:RimJ/RimL family protein N-acetyltransferase
VTYKAQNRYKGEMLQNFIVDEHIHIRPLDVQDSERIFEILETDSDIRDHVGLFGDCVSLEVLKEKIADQIAHWQDPDEKEFVQYNISYFAASEYRGQGVVGKSLSVLLGEAEKRLKINRFSAWVEEGNDASSKVLERLGFARTKIEHKDTKGRINWDYVREANGE